VGFRTPSLAKQKAISSAYVGNLKGLGWLGKNVGLQKKVDAVEKSGSRTCKTKAEIRNDNKKK
jgi:hypothetical protein